MVELIFAWIAKNKESLGVLGAIVAALVGGGWTLYRSRKEDRRLQEARRAETLAPSNDSPRNLAENRPAAAREPNIVLLACKNVPIGFADEFAAVEGHDVVAEAAVVVLRNDPIKGRLLARMVNTRALLTIKPDRGSPIYVSAAQWLDATINCVDFEPGDTNSLIIAIRALKGLGLVALDDRRQLNGPNDVRPVELPAEMTNAEVTVKLVGGFDGEFVDEFSFVLTVDTLTVLPR